MVRTRFAPSPTGYIHLGNVWVAFLNWFWTRQQGGQVVLRMEDIDRQRCHPAYAKALLDDLEWLGLDWDEGPGQMYEYGSAVQSERMPFYQACLDRWRRKGAVYPCYCTRADLRRIASAPHPGESTPAYDGHCRNLSAEERAGYSRPPSWRIRMTTEEVHFSDLFYGEQRKTLHAGSDDFVLARSDGMIAYQLAAAVDDGAMKISHVFRGNDLLSSTAGQVYLIQTMGYAVPVYAHVPLLVDRNHIRLSKRQHGITIRDLRNEGISADEIIGQLLFWAGAISQKTPLSAAQAVTNIDFADCTALNQPYIVAASDGGFR